MPSDAGNGKRVGAALRGQRFSSDASGDSLWPLAVLKTHADAASDPRESTIISPAAASGADPLGELALSLSGGGCFRAAAFHSSTALRILQRTGLLRNVVALSAVSGGPVRGHPVEVL